MSRKNKRGSQKPQVKKVFALIVDGETESWYIQKLKEQEKDILVGLDLQPKLPQKKKLEEIYEFIVELEKGEYDKIFWIVDFDTIIKETKKAEKGKPRKLDIFRNYLKNLSHKEKIIIIINNPCLEYWFLQHFAQTSKYFNSYEEVKKELKKHITGYDKTEDFYNNCNGRKGIYSFLKPRLKTAILNSKKLPKINFNETNINSSEIGVAEMYKLFEELK